ncbi:MAG: ribonuclease HII [Coriobacteriales bacterium]|nr:ribonuclease HII [Coriobacteriales bacterium]
MAPSIPEIHATLARASGRKLAQLLSEFEGDERAGVQAICASAQARLKAQRAEASRLRRIYKLEDELRAQGVSLIAGLDEVGRGCLAGPVTAAAVILPPAPRIDGLDDSKRLLPERREQIAAVILDVALASCVAHVQADEIDAIGMTAAIKKAMTHALDGCGLAPGSVLVDGLPVHVHPSEKAIVQGDSKVAAIAAASVIAKVERDALMRSVAEDYPGWGFDVHKGYSTAEHLAAIREMGVTPLHRRSFAPCADDPTLF